MTNKTPCRIVGILNGHPIYMHSYPTYVDIVINGQHKQFPNHESARLYLQDITKRSKCRERKEYEFITSQSKHGERISTAEECE